MTEQQIERFIARQSDFDRKWAANAANIKRDGKIREAKDAVVLAAKAWKAAKSPDQVKTTERRLMEMVATILAVENAP